MSRVAGPLEGGGATALTRKRLALLVLALAAAAGASHLWPTALMISGPGTVVWKGAGVFLLAGYAALLARTVDGWLLVVVLLCGATGDVLLETAGFIAGAAAFAAGHVVAIVLYRRNRRSDAGVGRLVGLVVAVAGSVAIWWLAGSVPITVYTGLLIGMTAAAWLSRFPRQLTGLGTALFVISDGLIFLRLDVLSTSIVATVATWALYFTGQLLIAVGVTRTLGTGPAESY